MNFFKILFVFAFICFVPSSPAAIVLKTKNKQALIHLEGLKTRKGAYFEAVNLYGKKQGIIQIKRVGNKKAIGVLKWGKMAKRWSLEPTSKKRVLALQKRVKRRAKIARIQKEKIKRKFHSRGKSLKKKKRRLAARKKQKRRFIASYQEPEESVSEQSVTDNSDYQNTQKDYDYQSQEVLSSQSSDPESDFVDADQIHEHSDLQETYSKDSDSYKGFLLGFAPRFEYNFVKISSRGLPGYTMTGPGWGFFALADFSITDLIRAGGNFGFKRFNASANEDRCGQRDCYLAINYLSLGLNIKLNVMDFDDHRLWLALEWNGMMPVGVDSSAWFDDRSFEFPYHGSLGTVLGFDFSIGDFVIPVTARLSVYMPPTATTIVFNSGLQAGVAYRF